MEEISHAEGRQLSIADTLKDAEEQNKRMIAATEKQLEDSEHKLKVLRETIAATKSEHVIATQALEDIRAQCNDLESAALAKRRSIEDEVASAQQQVRNRQFFLLFSDFIPAHF